MPVPADLDTLASLTRRDLLFLQRIADSATYSMIGREFGLCEASVKNRLGKILTTIGCDNRAHAVAQALRRGLIKSGDANFWQG